MDFKIGTSYSFRDYNCWHYICDIRANNGIKTKLFKPKSLSDAFNEIKSQMKGVEHGLTKVNKPENLDIAIVKNKGVYHCGLYYNGLIIHCSRQLKQVVSESLTDFKKHYSECTFWR